MSVTQKRFTASKTLAYVVALFLVTAALLALAPPGFTQNAINWIGGTGNWDQANLWSTGTTPDSDTDLVTIGSTSNGNVSLNVNATIGDLILTAGNTLQVSGTTLTVQAGTGTGGTVSIDAGGTLQITSSGTLTTSAAFLINASGSLQVITGTLVAGGALTNAGTADFGTITGTTAVTASAASLNNTGTLSLAAGVASGPTLVTTLSIAGAATNGVGATLSLAGSSSLSAGGDFSNSGTINVDNGGSAVTGGSSLSIGGTLTNNTGASVNIGSTIGNITAPATATVGALVNGGNLSVHGNIAGTSTIPASLTITGVPFAGGIPTQAFPAVNSGTLNVQSGASVSIAGNYGNLGTTNVDTTSDFSGSKTFSGGSTLSVSGVISNPGTSLSIGAANGTPPGTGIFTLLDIGTANGILNLGNSNLTQPTEVVAAGLNSLGTVNITGGSAVQALLDLTGPASANPFVQPPAVLEAGTFNLTNDAELQYAGPGINGIGIGVTVNLNGAGASINATSLAPNTGSGVNSALSTLGGSAGTFELSNGAAVATNAALNFINMGTAGIDQNGSGGSAFSVGGTLENGLGATLSIGNALITKPSSVTSVFFSNFGTLNITGAATTQALLNVTAQQFANPFLPASGVLGSGAYNLTNDAELEYLGPGISLIGPGVTVNLNGANASINATNLVANAASGTNSALNTLAANAGSFEVNNGGSVATDAGTNFINSGVMAVDLAVQGGSSIGIGGALTNANGGEIQIGSTAIQKPTTVTVNGSLTNAPSDVSPSQFISSGGGLMELSGGSNVQTTLNVAGAAPSALTGTYELTGDALLEFGSGAITTIASGGSVGPASLELLGTSARVGLAGNTSGNSALAELSMNGGSLTLASGAQVSTIPGVNLVNSGAISVDGANGGAGGSTLNIGGTVENLGVLSIGNAGITSSATVTAAAFDLDTLTGDVSVTGESPGSGSKTAALVLVNGIDSIAHGGTGLTLSNSNSYVSIAGTSPLSNGGLSGLTSNASAFNLQDGASVTTNAGLSFTNSGGGASVTVDAGALGSGSTSFNVGGAFDNAAALNISNQGTTGSSTAAVTAASLSNAGTITLDGATASHTAALTVSGGVFSSGDINVGTGYHFATLTVSGGPYTQIAGENAGITTVTGTLSAPSINLNDGGILQGSGAVIGNVLNLGATAGGVIASQPAGLAITGNYAQGAAGTLYETINGLTQFSSLNVSGSVSLSGFLDIGGYGSLSLGQTYDILQITSTSGSVSGAFSGIEYKGSVASGPLLNIGGGLALALTYNGNNVLLNVVSSVPSASADVWNAGTGTWNATNTSAWSAGAIPGPASDIVLGDVNNPTGGTVTLDASVSPVTANSLTATSGYTLSFGAANQSLTVNGSVGIDTGGEIDLENSGDVLATGKTGNGNLTNFGTLNVANGAALNVGGAGLLTNAGTMTVQNGSTVTVAGDFLNGLPGGFFGVGPLPTVSFEAAGSSTISGNFTNNQAATFNVDDLASYVNNQLVGGGTTLTIAGTLTNAGSLTIGNGQITSPTTLNVGGLANAGSLSITGGSSVLYGSSNVPALLNITGNWVPSSGAFDAGFYSVNGDAQIQYAGPGIASIGGAADVTLNGAVASINDTSLAANNSAGTNSALNTLTNNYGFLILNNGAQVQTNAGLNLTNNGDLEVDTSGQGGSSLAVGGTLLNFGSIQIGAPGTQGPDTVSAAGFVNYGQIELYGCTSAPCGQTLLDITGPVNSFVPASGALNQGYYYLSGNSAIAYSGPGISSIGTGASIQMEGGASIESSAAPNNGSTNSALNTLANNAGLLDLGEGASVSTNAGLDLTNTGQIQLSGASSIVGSGATNLAVGGTLINNESISITAGSLTSATLTAAGFSNSGSVYIVGDSQSNTFGTLDITGVASSNPFVSASGALSTGNYIIAANGQIEYSGPGITTIPNGAAISLSGSTATITATSLPALTASGVNSALNTLAVNSGNLLLDDTQVTTSGALLNTGGILALNSYLGSSPGSGLNIGGVLTNTSTISGACGSSNAGICVDSGMTLSAAGLVNNGVISVAGSLLGVTPAPATMSIAGAASNSGTLVVDAGAQLAVSGPLTNLDTGTLSIAASSGPVPATVTNVSVAGFDNSGTVKIGSPTYDQGSLTVTGSGNAYTQTGPLALTTVSGVLTAPAVNVNGGVLRGNGTINGNVLNGATLAAVNPTIFAVGCSCQSGPGLLTINGNYTQTSGGVLDELIQGPVKPGTDFGAINVSGSVKLSGALDITTLNFQLSANQSFDLMNFAPGTLTGAFTALDYSNLAIGNNAASPLNIGGGLALTVVYNNSAGDVLLDVVPLLGPPSYDNWVGNTDVWSNPLDWSNGAAPTSSQDAYVGTGSTGGTVTFDETSATVKSLTVEFGNNPIESANYILAIPAGNTLNVTNTVTNSDVLTVLGASASLVSGGNFTNSAGELFIANGATVAVGSTSAPANLTNAGQIELDSEAGYETFALANGGGKLTVSGALINTGGSLLIGNSGNASAPGITAETILSAGSVAAVSSSGTLANTLDGLIEITGENPAGGSVPAVLQLGASVTAIAQSGTLVLGNGNSYITTDAGNFTNDGLAALTSNAGTLTLYAGPTVTVGGTLSNSGTINLVTSYYPTNSSTIGYLPTTLNLGGLNNTGSVVLDGCSGCAAQALLDITGPAGSFVPNGGALSTGNYSLLGNSEIAYTGSGIASIGQGVNITLNGAGASITDASLTPNNGINNSAFNTLASNAGAMLLNGGSIVTNQGLNLTNTGEIEASTETLGIGGTFTNNGGVSITAPGLYIENNSTLTAAGLINTGVMFSDVSSIAINGAAANSGQLGVGGTLQVAGSLTNSAGGILGVGGLPNLSLSGASVTAAGLANQGTVNILAVPGNPSATSSLTITGSGNSYAQSGSAATTLVLGNLTAPAININGGVLLGNGLITGNVNNTATVAASAGPSAPALLTISGSYAQASGAALDEIVGGATTRGTDYAAMNISGSVALAGTLNVTAVNNFTFAADDSFNIMNLAPNGLSGTFDTLQYNGTSASGTGLLNIGGDLALALAYDGSNGEVLLDVVTPDNWTGAAGNWSAAANWSIGVPGPTQIVNIGTGSGGTVTLDQSASIYNLNLEPGTSSGYTLAFNPSETLATAGTVNLGAGTEMDLEYAGTKLTSGGDFTNAGTLQLENGGVADIGTANEPRNFNNTGTVLVDTLSTGGSALDISGTLSNAGGTIEIGGASLSSSDTLIAKGFTGDALTGTVHLEGNGEGGAQTATIALQNGITSIAPGADLLLLNGNSQVNLSGTSGANSALTGLANVAGSLQLESGSSLSTGGDLNIAATGSVGVDEFLFTAGNSSLSVNGTLNNAGTFSLGSGGFGLGTPPAIVSSAIVSGFNNSGTAQIGGGFSTAVSLSVNGAATNSGTVTIAAGGEMNVTGSNAYTQTAGATTVNGILISSQTVALNGGTLQGSGYIGANVSNNAATVQGGADASHPGTLSLGGSYTQGAGGTLNVVIGGASAGQFSVLSAAQSVGGVTLSGALNISTINNFQFQVGQSFDIINFPASSLSGSFTELEFDCSAGPANCVTDTTPGNGTPLVITQGGTPLGFVVDYQNTGGAVLLNVETPPPTAVSWTGTSGAWSVTSAWSDGLIPLGYQDVTIGGAAGGNVTYDQASSTIDSLAIGAGTVSQYSLSFNANTSLSVTRALTIGPGGAVDVITAGSSLATGGDLTNAGVLNVANGGSLTVGSPSAPANLTNTGTMDVDAGSATGGGSATVYGAVSNTGALNVGSASLTSATSMTTGAFTNGGELVLTGSSAANSASLAVNGNFTNILQTTIGGFSNLTVLGSSNSYTQNCLGLGCLIASTTVSGTLTAPAVNINGGVLQGTGVINGSVTNAAAMTAGSYFPLGSPAPGNLTINGNFSQTSSGLLQETIFGTGAPGTTFSSINVSGSVTLGGTLQVSTGNGFSLASGQTFDILNFIPGSLSGTFATIAFGTDTGLGSGAVSIGNNLDLSLNYNNIAGHLVLQVGTLDTWIGTTDVWTGPNDAANWSTGAKPASTDDVLVGGGTGGTVTYNETGDTIQSLTVQPGQASGAYKLAFGINDGLVVTDAVNIAAGGEIDVEANGAALVAGGGLSNAGTLVLGQSATPGQGGTAGQGGIVQIGTPQAVANLTNTGTIDVDPAATPVSGVTPPTGGSDLTISGALVNTGGTLNIGNTGISSQSEADAGSLAAVSGTGTVANTLDGTIVITGQDPAHGATAALLKLGAGITNIAATGSLTLANSNSFLTLDASSYTNDALSGLATNAGTLALEGGSAVALAGSLTNSGAFNLDASTATVATGLSNSGTLSLADGSSVTIGPAQAANFTNSSQVLVDGTGGGAGGSTLRVNGTLDNTNGTILIGNATMTAPSTLTADGFAANTLVGTVTIYGDAGVPATLSLASGINTISGTLALFGADAFVNVNSAPQNNSGLSGLATVSGNLLIDSGASVTDSGALNVAASGTVIVDDGLLSLGGSSLTLQGALNNAGTFSAGAGGSAPTTVSAIGLNNTGVMILGIGPATTFTVSGAANNSGAVTIAGAGTLNVTGGVAYTQSAGSTTIASGGSLNAASYAQNGGTTNVNGSLTAPSGVTLNAGTMQGIGTIAANVANIGGTLRASPDSSNPGALTINGSYNQGTAGTLAEIIGPGQSSMLNITGSLTLAGTLSVSTINSFTFAAGQTFDVINYPVGGLSGTFGTLAYNGVTGSGTSTLDISSSLGLVVDYNNPSAPGVVQLSVVSISTTDIWNDNSDPCLTSTPGTCNWTDGNNDATNWSLGVAPQQTTNPQTGVVSGANDVIIGGGPGGSVTLNTNAEVKSLTVEASDNTNPSTNYTLVINGQYTLTDDKTLTIDQGGEIDVTAKGAVLTAKGSASDAGTLTLANGGSVTIGSPSSGGTGALPTNFTNYITPNQTQGNTGPTVGGTINVDATGAGGSTLTINGTLINENPSDKTTGTVTIGNAGITANATMVIQDFGVAGTLDGTINIAGPSSGTVQAALSLTNSSGVTGIAATGSLTLSGKNAYLELSSQTGSNSALANLATNAGKLELDNGAKVSTNAEYTQTSGTTTISGSGSQLQVLATSAPANVGVDIQSGSTLSIENKGDVCVGTQACQQSGTTRDLTNEGTINVVTSGTLNVSGNITNNAGAAIALDSTGNLVVGTGSNPSSGNVINNGTVTVNGTLNNSGNLTNGGILAVNGTAVTSGNVSNFGQITIDGHWDPVNFTQTAGSTVVNGSLVAGTFDLQGGTLSGTGTITGTINLQGGTLSGNLTTSGDVVNASTLTPNNGATPPMPGTMTVNGNYTQTSSGTFDDLIGGTSASSQYGQLDILDAASLDGTLDVLADSFTDGFTFGSSDTYNGLLTAGGGISGAFSTLEFDCPGPNCVMENAAELGGTDTSASLSILDGLYTLDLVYGTNSIDLQVTQVPVTPTPEPSILLLLGMGFIGVICIARWGKTVGFRR